MKTSLKTAVLAATVAVLVGFPMHTQGQDAPPAGGPPPNFGGGRGFNREEMRQRMMDYYKETLQVKSDDEWQVIQPRIQKVLDARREASIGGGGMRGMFGPRRGGDNQGDQQQRRANFGPQPSAAAQALQKAIDSGSKDEIKAKLAAYREEREQKKAALEKSQEDLKKVLNVKQEAAAVLAGLLD